MNYAAEHGISPQTTKIEAGKTDTLTLKKQIELKVLAEISCVNKETILYLNPAYKKNIFPKDGLFLPEGFVLQF